MKYLLVFAIFGFFVLLSYFYNNHFKNKLNHFGNNNYPEPTMENFDDTLVIEKQKIEINEKKSKNEEKITTDCKSNTTSGQLKENFKSGMSENSRFLNRSNKKLKNSKNKALINIEDDYYFGSDEAPVTIIQYSSFLCPHCVSFHNNIMDNLTHDYINKKKVRFVSRIIAQPETLPAVMLPYCAKESNRYSLLNDIYKNVSLWSKNSKKRKIILKEIALRNNFTESEFEDCVNNKNLAEKIVTKQNKDIKSLNVFSTPTFFINGTRYQGNIPYYSLKEKIEIKLKEQNIK